MNKARDRHGTGSTRAWRGFAATLVLLVIVGGGPRPASAEDDPPPPPRPPLERLFAPLKEQLAGLPPFFRDTDFRLHFRTYYFNRTKPDIVLMDITMHQMEGIEAVERIVRQHPDARIVMVSSVGYQENILAALQKGAKHFVQKPVKPEVLYEILRYVLSDDPSLPGAPVALAGEHRS